MNERESLGLGSVWTKETNNRFGCTDWGGGDILENPLRV